MRNRDLGNEVADFGREVHGRGDLPVACGVEPEGVFTEGFFEGAGRGLAGEPKVSPMARYALDGEPPETSLDRFRRWPKFIERPETRQRIGGGALRANEDVELQNLVTTRLGGPCLLF